MLLYVNLNILPRYSRLALASLSFSPSSPWSYLPGQEEQIEADARLARQLSTRREPSTQDERIARELQRMELRKVCRRSSSD